MKNKINRALVISAATAVVAASSNAEAKVYPSAPATDFVYPTISVESLQIKLKNLSENLKNNDSFTRYFKENPRTVLQEYGFSKDVQREILSEVGISISDSDLDSCACTGCCLTSINA